MTKLLKIVGNSILILLEIVLIALIFLSFAIRTSKFQTFLAHKASDYLSEMLETHVSIGKVHIAFFDRVYFDNLYVEDLHQDTLFSVKELYVNYQLNEDFLDLNFHLDKVKVTDARAALKRYAGENKLNLHFIADAFINKDKEKKEVDFKFLIDEVEVVNSHFSFENEDKVKIPFGVDYMNVDVRALNVKAKDVEIHPDTYIATFENIALIERSGFVLNNYEGYAKFNGEGLRLGETKIFTDNSHLQLDSFAMKTESLADYREFIDNVELVSSFDTSYVSLKDVSYFAPQLKGMNDIIVLKGGSSKTVQDLTLNNIILKYGSGTEIRGTFALPDFRRLSKENIQQQIDYIALNVRDLERFRLPDASSIDYIKWPKTVSELTYFRANQVRLNGRLENLHASIKNIKTNLGNIEFDDAFTANIDTTFSVIKITPAHSKTNFIKVEQLMVNRLVKNSNIGEMNGNFGLSSVEINPNGVFAKNINGELVKSKIFGYQYEHILMDNLNYTLNKTGRTSQNEALGNIYVRDENFDLSFHGFMSIGNFLEIDALIDVECAMLDELHPSLEGRGELITTINIDAKGKNFNDFKGNLTIDSLFYQEGDQVFQTRDFHGFVERNKQKDSISIQSDIVDANVHGLIDYAKVSENIKDQLTKVFPALNLTSKEDVADEKTHFVYDMKIKHVNNLLSIFKPELRVADKTHLWGNYNGAKNNLALNIDSDYLSYNSIRFNSISGLQEVSNQELLALIDIDGFSYRDSTMYKGIHFTGLASRGGLDSQLLFDDMENKRSNLEWFTNLRENSAFDIAIYPSYLTFSGKRWDIKQMARIEYADSCFVVDNLKLEYNKQYISANGNLSNSTFDRLYVDVMDLNLKEVSDILFPETNLSGIANVSGYATTPLLNFRFFGEAVIDDFYVNETEVGGVGFGMDYSSGQDEMQVYGDIFYRNIQTFHFNGDYVIKEGEKSRGEMDINMLFKQTDISVVKEFLPKDFLTKLQGKINGELNLTGTLNDPTVEGVVNMRDGMANLGILGADMFFEGEIISMKDEIHINQMPLTDAEGNTGYITGTLMHNNFKDIFFEILANMEEHPTKRLPNDPSKPLPVDRFLAMRTNYEVGSYYYGDGYITGIAEISGYLDNLSILVNAKTRRGTKFVLPLFGPTTIEEDGFIRFKKSELEDSLEARVNLSGIDLQLNFEVTDDAEVKLILNDQTDEELTARGKGNINLSVDQFNELAMDGTYTVSKGNYNFVFGPYSQKFEIAPGGTVQWVGDPYDAILDIYAYYKTSANLSVVMPDVVVDQKTSNNEEIYTYLSIKGNMMQPELSFDIDAPKATESGKAILSRIRSDKDELNKQFFSLIISKSFMPLDGQIGSAGTSGAFLDLASTQINNILNKMADGYNMNVNLESDDFTGQFSGEFGLSKAFLDDRLLISGSFGVGTRKGEGEAGEESVPNQNTFIGDVKIEYLLNEDGTFRINAFNESNTNYILQNENRSNFTQGIGISYKEDFYNFEDFKLFQFFANMFRKKENKVNLSGRRSNKVPIPDEYLNNKDTIKEEE